MYVDNKSEKFFFLFFSDTKNKMARMIIIFLFLLLPMIDCYTTTSINLLVRSLTTSYIQRYCIELAKLPNDRVINITNFGWHTPYLFSSSVNACNISDLNASLPNSFPSNTILIIYENNCKMTEHAWNVQTQFGSEISLMIITNRTNTQYELTYNITTMPVSIPVLIFWTNDFNAMLNKYSNLNSIELSIDNPPDVSKKFRPSIILMFLLVLFVLLCGNFWAADEFKYRINEQYMETDSQLSNSNTSSQSSRPTTTERSSSSQVITNERSLSYRTTKRNSVTPSELSQKMKPAVIPMTYCVVVFIILFAVGWLLLLYYFPKVMIYILQGKY